MSKKNPIQPDSSGRSDRAAPVTATRLVIQRNVASEARRSAYRWLNEGKPRVDMCAAPAQWVLAKHFAKEADGHANATDMLATELARKLAELWPSWEAVEETLEYLTTRALLFGPRAERRASDAGEPQRGGVELLTEDAAPDVPLYRSTVATLPNTEQTMLEQDVAIAIALERTGKDGTKAADRFRKESEARWKRLVDASASLDAAINAVVAGMSWQGEQEDLSVFLPDDGDGTVGVITTAGLAELIQRPVGVRWSENQETRARLVNATETARGELSAAQRDVWSRWLDPIWDDAAVWDDNKPAPSDQPYPRFVESLAYVLWLDVVLPRLEREKGASDGLSRRVVVVGGHEFAKLPKIVAPLSWAFGAPGRAAVEIDGDSYAKAPDVAADVAAPKRTKVVSRSWALLPDKYKSRPHQTSLPIGREGDSSEPMVLPIAITSATQYALTPAAAKTALVILADPLVRRGGLACVSLGALAKTIHGGVQRIRARELEATAEGIASLRSLLVYLPDDTTVQLFDVQAPADKERAQGNMLLHLGLTGTAVAVIGGDTLGSSYKGEFLFNLTGAMRLPNKKPALLRHLLRGSAHWNAAFDPSTKGFAEYKLPAYTPEEWAVLTNALPPSVVDYIEQDRKGQRSRAVSLSKAKAEVKEDLAELAEEHGLIRIEKKPGGKLAILPPEAWLEAFAQHRKGAARPPEEPG